MSRPSDPEGQPAVPEAAPLTPQDRSADAAPGLPAEAYDTGAPLRRPVRPRPRTGDLVLTGLLTATLYVIVAVNVAAAFTRADSAAGSLPESTLANILAEYAPIAIGVFSTVFSALFLRRRVPAFWLPIVAGVLVVALYSVTDQLIQAAVVTHVVG